MLRVYELYEREIVRWYKIYNQHFYHREFRFRNEVELVIDELMTYVHRTFSNFDRNE